MACQYLNSSGEWVSEEELLEEYNNGTLFQLGETSSKASAKTLDKMKEWLKRVGINIKSLDTSRFGNINGVAQLLENTIQIAEGKEDVALLEEGGHFITEMTKQANPSLYKAMLNKIGSYALYKQVFTEYSKNQAYQNSDGTPNVIKLKEEAIGKVLAEYYLQSEEGKTEKPELLQQTHNWWEQIKQWILSLIGKAQYNPFEEVISNLDELQPSQSNKQLINQIDTTSLKGIYGIILKDLIEKEDYSGAIFLLKNQLEDPQTFKKVVDTFLSGNEQLGKDILGGEYFQLANKAVDDAYEKFLQEDKNLILVGQGTDDRHYTYNGERVAKTVTSKIDDGKKFGERSEIDQFKDDQKREWGSIGHEFAEAYFNTLIDENGYKRSKPLNTTIKTTLPNHVQTSLKTYFTELVNSYPVGTRFAVENKVINTKEKGLLASTIDFLAFQPDAKTGVKVDILDWKFFNMNKSKTSDVPWYKTDKWKKQMAEYVTIGKQYGLKPEQIGKARMVPFITNYDLVKKSDPMAGLKLTSIEIGDVNTQKEIKIYLLPVAADEESTGSPEVDQLITKLKGQYEKIANQRVGEEEKENKKIQLNTLASAIKVLQIKKDFKPLYDEAALFQNKAKQALDKYAKVDFTSMSLDEINLKLGELIQLKQSASVYDGIDEIFLSVYPKEIVVGEQLEMLKKFEHLSQTTGRLEKAIQDVQNKAATAIALKEKIVTGTEEEAQEKILSPELEIKGITKSFLEVTKLPNRIINLLGTVVQRARRSQYIEEKSLVKQFEKILTPYLEATKSFKNPLDAIRDMSSTKLQLLPKIRKEFWNERKKAAEDRDIKFFLNNVNIDQYYKEIQAKVDQEQENIDNTPYPGTPEEVEKLKRANLNKLVNSLDIKSDEFNGWDSPLFKYYYNRNINEDKNTSEEYKKMAATPALLDVWNFYSQLNERGRKNGYIDEFNFLPLIRATIIEQVAQSNNIFKTSSQILKESYILDVNEKTAHAIINKETGEVEKRIPRLFTSTDRETSQLSQDMTKITAPWIRALLQYETSQNLENIAQTLYDVEESKGHLQINPTNSKEIIFEGDSPRIFEGNESNTALLGKIVDDSIYGITEDSNTFLDLAIDKATKGTEEEKTTRKIQGKKILKGANAWTQALATGAKLAVSIPNFIGGKLQGIINAGTTYRGREYEINHNKLCGSFGKFLTAMDKALIDMIHPLNEDVSTEASRDFAKKKGFISYLTSWSIQDAFQSVNRLGDLTHEYTNALTMNDNTMVVDGKLVNIREYLRKQDSKKYSIDFGEENRKALENTFEARVKELKDTKALKHIATLTDEGVSIPAVSKEELARYATGVVEQARKISGQMSRDNKADYTRSTMFKSFMMFKNWIPKQLEVRYLGIRKNYELDTWEYGRTRLFAKTLAHLGFKRIFDMRQIIAGTDKGLAIMKEILDEKKESYYRATGQQLDISEEEFYDMVRKELHSQSKELLILFSMISLFLAAKLAAPDDDDDELTKNRYKWWRKITNKISNEIDFYYNPASADSITRGSVVPSLGLLTKAFKFFGALEEETRGYIISDDELIDKEHPLKYFLNLVPGPAQFQNNVLPYISPELAKDNGIRVSAEARQGQ